MLSVELNKTIFFLHFDLIRSGIECMTELICGEHITTFIGFGVTHRGSNQRVIAYCTRGEHADHYTIDVVDGI
jgi:hypothetical protein